MQTDLHTQVQRHRQSQAHANGIALGSPDMSKGIRADGWHCLDYGDNPGCGAMTSMENGGWCSVAHKHLVSPTHAKRIAEPDVEKSRHYAWKCVDDGDHKGCGVLGKARPDIWTHRHSKIHANGIALGAPDMSKGIRADGWHCLDDGDKSGCGAVLSMKRNTWCSEAHLHLLSAAHARRIAEPRREQSPYYAWQCVDEGDQQGCGWVTVKSDMHVRTHRQSLSHANAIAIGAPDMSKGIRADGWHCLDYHNKPGCGAVLSMEITSWCSKAQKHLMSPTHAKAVAALRRKQSRKRRRASVDVESEADAPQSPAVAVVAAADDESDNDADDA
jgi:hypothetical protein